MKEKWTKLGKSLICLALVTSMLAGCGGGGKSSSSSEKQTSGGTSGEVAAGDDNFNETGLPIVKEPVELTFLYVKGANTMDFKDNAMFQQMEKDTNVKINWQYAGDADWSEQKSLLLASGDLPDVFFGDNALKDNDIATNLDMFIPLEDYFEKYCPNISAILDLPGVREKMTAPDGHIYTIPYVCTDTTVGYSPYINTKWLENVGMSMPTTTDEFEAVLKAFKEQDANGNGDASDEIPFSTDPNNKHIEAMAGYFGLPMNKLGIAIQNEKVVYGGVSDTYREFLSWFHKLYAEGLVDVELYTQDSSTWEGKGNQDLYGVSIAYGSNEFTGIPAAEERGDFDSMPVLNTDKDGIWLRDTEGFSVYRTQAVITNKAEHPEIICRWFDNAFALENGIGCNRGPVGVIVNKEDDGYHAIDTTTLSEEDQEKYSWGNLWPQSLPKYLPVDFEFVEEHPMYDEKKATEEAYEANLTKEIIPSYWIDLDKIDTFSDTNTAIKDFFEQQQAQFVCGELDIDNDADWQAYVDGMYSLGLEDWVATQGIEEIAK